MEKVIEGKIYNTETDKQVAGGYYSNYGEFQYWCEELFRTDQGNWFVYGEGGEKFSYARTVEQNASNGGNDITPLTKKEALAWIEVHNPDADALEEYFADVLENA